MNDQHRPKLSDLPAAVLDIICAELEPFDAAALAAACSRLRQIVDAKDSKYWKQKTMESYSARVAMEDIVVNVLGVPVSPQHILENKFSEAESWKAAYKGHAAAVRKSHEVIESADAVPNGGSADADQARYLADLASLQDKIQKFVKDGRQLSRDSSDVKSAVDHILNLQGQLPTHPVTYYLLAVLCDCMSELEAARVITKLGLEMQCDYEPLTAFMEYLDEQVKRKEEGRKFLPMIGEDGDLTDRFKTALRSIFDQFDLDGDDRLSHAELDALIFVTTKKHQTKKMLQSFCAELNDDRSCDHLTFDSLCRFYHLQTLDDPKETLSDLVMHGFDKETLVRTQVPKPA